MAVLPYSAYRDTPSRRSQTTALGGRFSNVLSLRVHDRQPTPGICFGDSTPLTALMSESGRAVLVGVDKPVLQLRGWGCYRFRLPVEAGDRTISIKTLQPTADAARPWLQIKANSDIGVVESITPASTGAGWVTIGPVAFTASGTGAIEVYLVNPSDGRICWFDQLKMT